MIIEAENLAKRYGRHEAVESVSLRVPEGAAMALIGANGAGKTTTLRMLVDLIRPDGGTATVLGVDSRKLRREDRARIGYVSESQKLPTRLTVSQFFDYLRPLYPTWDRELETQLRETLDLPGDRRIGKLSHGMRVKTALAAALPFRPAVMILDEPLSGLDPLVRDEVLEGLLGQAGEMTILISSHELSEIEGFATHIAYMAAGKIDFQEPTDELLARHRSVMAVFPEGAVARAAIDPRWLGAEVSGSALSFVEPRYTDSETLSRKLPGADRIDARPMSLRDISTTLIRASRKETRR